MTDATTVTLHLPTRTGDSLFGTPRLWTRQITMAHLPTDGDLIALHDDGQMFLKVRARYWSTTGHANLDMQGFVIDPTTDQDANDRRFIPWRTAVDGDLNTFLTENGWNLQ